MAELLIECMDTEDVRRRIRENPELLIDALNDILLTDPNVLIRALVNRPDTLLRLLMLITVVPLAIPTVLLRLFLAPALSLGSCGDLDAIRARISEVERRISEMENSIVRKNELESLVKGLLDKYGIKG